MSMQAEISGYKALGNLLKQFPDRIQRDVVNSVAARGATVVKNRAKQNLRANGSVETGTLLRSLRTRKKKGTHGVYLIYADRSAPHCVFGSRNTKIKTKNGFKTIGSIQIGDEVLTQTGEYKSVINTRSFSAEKKPNLVEVKVQNLHGGKPPHVLNLTEDHKVLVYRDGRNKWVMAGEILLTDCVYEIKKISPNKTKKECTHCGGSLAGVRKTQINNSRKYCCIECCKAAWKEENPHLGKKRSDSAKKKMSIAAKNKFKNNPDLHPNRILCQNGHETETEKEVAKWLDDREIYYIRQKKIGEKFVDFYLPYQGVVIEADGAYWHQNQEIDIERDKYIKNILPTATIIHLHFFNERFSPEIDNEPIENVYYVSCNPGTSSYVDLEKMQRQKVLSVKKWKYKRKGNKCAKLYDITVEGVHSYVANGVVISNSHLVEFGTGPRKLKKPIPYEIKPGEWITLSHTGQAPAKPFFRPAMDEEPDEILKEMMIRMAKRMEKEAAKMAQRYGTMSKSYRRKLAK